MEFVLSDMPPNPAPVLDYLKEPARKVAETKPAESKPDPKGRKLTEAPA